METPSPAKPPGLVRILVIVVLRVALIAALIAAGWSVYRRLPHDASAGAATDGAANTTTTTTALLIILRVAPGELAATKNTPVEIYSIDIAAARREFISEPHPGLRFDDFLARRMNGRTVVKTQLDNTGRATVAVTPGKWWIHATFNAGEQSLEWRLPVNVTGQRETIELTPGNAYARTKSF